MQSRREFMLSSARISAGCVAHVALASACSTASSRARFTAPRHRVVATTPFAHLDLVANDTWAVVSTPFGGDRTTYANGGIIAGRSGVAVVEGFYRPAGATWLAEQARRLTGRWPTHVILTHYHTDHSGGLAGYLRDGSGPRIMATQSTRETAMAGGPVAPQVDEALARAFADVTIIPATAPGTIDLGNRVLELMSLDGHTASDVALVDRNEGVLFTGDLVWNGMFPNYVDAIPTRLASSVELLSRIGAATIVVGHGAVADKPALTRYQDLLSDVERAARAGFRNGSGAKEVAAAYSVPATLGEWMAGKPAIERAIDAWYKEFGAE